MGLHGIWVHGIGYDAVMSMALMACCVCEGYGQAFGLLLLVRSKTSNVISLCIRRILLTTAYYWIPARAVPVEEC
jgi:hypothetical protein